MSNLTIYQIIFICICANHNKCVISIFYGIVKPKSHAAFLCQNSCNCLLAKKMSFTANQSCIAVIPGKIEHCQHDNPTLGQERMADWLADQFAIDQRAMAELLSPE